MLFLGHVISISSFFIFLEAKNKLTVKLTVKKTTSARRRHTARKLMRIHVPKCCQREKQLSDRKTTGLTLPQSQGSGKAWETVRSSSSMT